MAYAVIRLGGKQIKVSEGQTFEIESVSSLDNEVLAYSDGKKVEFGLPIVKGATVVLEKVEEKNADKIRVVKFKAKSRYKRQVGHKQPMFVLKVKSISK